MNITVTKACINEATSTLNIELSFANVASDSFQGVDAHYIKRSGKDVIICHFNTVSRTEVELGTESFILNFGCRSCPNNLKEAHFFWWNDDASLNINKLDAVLLQTIDDAINSPNFKEVPYKKSATIKDAVFNPKQGGNGGVLGITSC